MGEKITLKRDKKEIVLMCLALAMMILLFFYLDGALLLVSRIFLIATFVYYFTYIVSLIVYPIFMISDNGFVEIYLSFFRKKRLNIGEIESVHVSEHRLSFKGSYIKLVGGKKIHFLFHQIDRVDRAKFMALFGLNS